MENWKELEFHYASRLRTCSQEERRALYREAYSEVYRDWNHMFRSDKPEDRTQGSSSRLVEFLSQMVDANDRVLEIGCGRGYTCLRLSPHVRSMVGTDVSEPNLNEAREVISRFQRTNVRIEQVPAFELTDHFGENEFDVCVSIDVVEHLHPEDAKEHYRQVYHILKPGGKYIVIMPNRIGGPHDVTLEEFPEAKEALGFHLNESTYRETTQVMGEVGFVKFRQIFGVKLPRMGYVPILLPCWVCGWAEVVFGGLLGRFRNDLFARLVAIRLIGYKRGVPLIDRPGAE